MEEKIELLKSTVIDTFLSCADEYDKDEPYLNMGDRSLSINQMMESVREGGEDGMMIIGGLIGLTIDLLQRQKAGGIVVALNPSQQKSYKEWKESFQLETVDVAGAHFGVKVIFTGVGQVISGFNWKGDEIDLTDYSTW